MHKNLLAVFAALSLTQLFGATATEAAIVLPADTVRPDGMYNAYVIYGAEITDSVLDKGCFVVPVNISETTVPDSELEILFAHDGSIAYAADKTPIFRLFPDAQRFVVGEDTLSRCEFAGYPVALLNSVTAAADGSLLVDVRPSVHDISSAYRAESDEEHYWLTKHKEALTPEPFALDDVSSYPEDALLSVDYMMRSHSFAEAIAPKDMKVFRVSKYGNKLHIEILTDDSRYRSVARNSSGVTIIPASQPKSLTLADILAELPRNTRSVVVTPTYILAHPLE